jgi:hypothetical protein
MKPTAPALAIAAVLFANAALANDWKTELAGPLVKIAGDKMIYEELELCTAPAEKGAQPTFFQVKTRSEAPKSKFISRDYFVAITASMIMEILRQFGEPDCRTLRAPIGTADIEINIYMAAEGMQVEFTNTGTGQKTRNTVRWEEMFADEKSN